MNVRQNDIITAFCKTTAELTLGCVKLAQATDCITLIL